MDSFLGNAKALSQSNIMDRSEEIDRNITKKYEVYNKLGKGVRHSFALAIDDVFNSDCIVRYCSVHAGLWRGMESCRKKDTSGGCLEEDFRCLSERHGRSGDSAQTLFRDGHIILNW